MNRITYVESSVLGLSILSSLVCLGMYLYTDLLYVKPVLDDNLEKKNFDQEIKGKQFHSLFKIEKIIVNLREDRQRLRFLSTIVFFQLNKLEFIEILRRNIFLMRDLLIDIISKMTARELNSLTGKILLKNRILTKINKALRQNIIKEIYFSKFIIQ